MSTGIGTLLAFLLSGNIYFVRRLVEKIEGTSEAHASMKESVGKLSQNMSGLSVSLGELKTEIKEFRRIEVQVAVLQSQFNASRPQILEAQ